jgi:alkyl hydroperoxide reductase subunit AhpC
MREHYGAFRAAGAQVVAIGMGSAARTAEFRERLAIPFPLLSDPRRDAYRAYGLGRLSVRREANLTSFVETARRAMRHGIAPSVDDPIQLGGVFVVDRAGVIRYAFRPERAYETAPVDDLLRVVVELRAEHEQEPIDRPR